MAKATAGTEEGAGVPAIEVPEAETPKEQKAPPPMYGNEGYESNPISAPPEKGNSEEAPAKGKRGAQ